MPPNRRGHNNNNHHNGGGGGGNNNQNDTRPMKCCVPTNECFEPGKLIYHADIGTTALEVVKVVCNNDHCDQSPYMHKECFSNWEQSVLTYLRSCGRARSWSEKQRLQNLWTKRGYDLAFKACSCKCGKIHLRKDLDWIAPTPRPAAHQPNRNNQQNNGQQQQQNGGGADNNGAVGAPAENNVQPPAVEEGKKKKKSKNKERPVLAISAPVPHPNNNQNAMVQKAKNNTGNANATTSGASTTSVNKVDKNENSSQSPSSTSPSTSSHGGIGSLGSSFSSTTSEFGGASYSSNNNVGSVDSIGPIGSLPMSVGNPGVIGRPRVNSLSSTASGSSGSGSPPSPPAQFGSPLANLSMFRFPRKNSKGSEICERTRHNSGSGPFCRRTDFSSFNALPRHKLNSYHIKMEDESHGSDDTRSFILTTLLNNKLSRVQCILCQQFMLIFDRYPLIDGTFFLSPRQHGKESIAAGGVEGMQRYLSAVCMGCLEGWSTAMYCRYCRCRWDGSSLVLGSCYSYDIFAATPCCPDRLKCGNCKGFLMSPDQRPNFFSEYSRPLRCGHCGTVDFHLAKSAAIVFDKYKSC